MKECKKCFLQIDDRASVCQHCQSSQRMIPNFTVSDILGVFVITICALFAIFTTYNANKKRDDLSTFTELKPTVLHVSTYRIYDGLYFSCIGEISNPTSTSFQKLEFEVSLYNPSGALIDISLPESENLNVPANGTARFRLSSAAANPNETYSRCDVKITKASNRSS